MTEARIVLLGPGARELLAIRSSQGRHLLVRTEVSMSDRLVPQIHHALQTRYGLRGIVLDFLSTVHSASLCVAFELFTAPLMKVFHAVAVDAITTNDLSESERMAVAKLQTGRAESPMARSGWIDEAIAWTEETTHRKVTSKHDIEQYNAGRSFALLRFSMADGRRVWLKATSRSNAHELAISSLLSKLCAGFVPDVIGVHTHWNAWLMAELETSATTFPRCEQVTWARKLEHAVEALAALQCRTMRCETELFASGAFDQRLPRLKAHSDALFERVAEAMSLQTSTKNAHLDGASLRRLRSVFKHVCDVVGEHDTPAAVIHGDMSAGNLAFASDRCWFLDWCEAYVGWPYVTLQHLLLLNRPEDKANKAAADRALIKQYCDTMSAIGLGRNHKCAIACMPLLAAASALYGRGEWIDRSLENDIRRQKYVRTLAWHMNSAAQSCDLLDAIQARSFITVPDYPVANDSGERIDAAPCA